METPVSPKVTVAVFAAAIITILVYGMDVIWHVDVPVLIQGAITAVIVGIAGWVKKDPIRAVGAAVIAVPPNTIVGTIPEVVELAASGK